MGELALITDYWNETKFKHKHPVANLPASHHGIKFDLLSFSMIRTQIWYIGVVIMYPKIYTSLYHQKYIKKREKKILRKIKGSVSGDRTREPLG